MARQEYIIEMKIVMSIEDLDDNSTMSQEEIEDFAKEAFSVNFDYENSFLPESAGEDATVSMAADFVSVSQYNGK